MTDYEDLARAYDTIVAERDALKAQLDSLHQLLAEWARKEALRGWADWIESRSAHVPGITIEQIVAALRSGHEPFGITEGEG